MAMHIDSELSATGIAFVGRRLDASIKHAGEHPTIDTRCGRRTAGRRRCCSSPSCAATRPSASSSWAGRGRWPTSARAARRSSGCSPTEAASAIAHTDLVGRLGELAATDALTGLRQPPDLEPRARPGPAGQPTRATCASRCSTSTTSRPSTTSTATWPATVSSPPARGMAGPAAARRRPGPPRRRGVRRSAHRLHAGRRHRGHRTPARRDARPARPARPASSPARATSRPRSSWPARTTRSTRPSTPVATSCSPPEAPQPAELHSGGS